MASDKPATNKGKASGGSCTGPLIAAHEPTLNASAPPECSFAENLAATKRASWLAENREAIEVYNEHVAKYGTFADDGRTF